MELEFEWDEEIEDYSELTEKELAQFYRVFAKRKEESQKVMFRYGFGRSAAYEDSQKNCVCNY